jgi:hypothetical protein
MKSTKERGVQTMAGLRGATSGMEAMMATSRK